jgi:hypothetical protein
MQLDITKRYAVEGYPGIEFYTIGWCMVWIPDDEQGEEGSWVADPSSGQAIMIPVGDEEEHYVNIDDVSEIQDDGTVRKLPERVFSD